MSQSSDKPNKETYVSKIEELKLNRNGRSKMELAEMISLDIEKKPELAEKFILRPGSMDDVEKAFALFEACSKHMIGKSETTLSHLRSEWTSPGFSLERSVRVVESSAGELVGYIEVWDTHSPPVSVWVWGRVHPKFEDQGIGTQLMQWAETRARQAIDRAPEKALVVMRSGTFSHYDPGRNLLIDQNMTFVRHFFTMAIEFEQNPKSAIWPDGITVRTMNGEEEFRDVVLADRDVFKDHWGFVEQPFDEEYDQWLHFIRNDDKFDPTLWYLAMDGDEIAGISLCREESDEDPDQGWVDVLGVRRPWRRKGLGLALLNHSFGELWRRGKKSAGLGVDASSLTGATGLYEKAGMRTIRQFDLYEKELRPGKDLTKQAL